MHRSFVAKMQEIGVLETARQGKHYVRSLISFIKNDVGSRAENTFTNKIHGPGRNGLSRSLAVSRQRRTMFLGIYMAQARQHAEYEASILRSSLDTFRHVDT